MYLTTKWPIYTWLRGPQSRTKSLLLESSQTKEVKLARKEMNPVEPDKYQEIISPMLANWGI